VSRSTPTVEPALTDLQNLVRRPPPAGAFPVASGKLPDDLQSEKAKAIGLLREEHDALACVRELLAEDLRFEHLKEDRAEEATWRFVCLAHVREGDHVADFVAAYAREPMDRTCFLPLELLTVTEETEIFGVRLVPLEAASPPDMLFGPPLTEQARSVVAVPAHGTNYTRMGLRAREVAEHALRLLRATLREHRWIPDNQLRFRLGTSVWFDDQVSGWTAAADQGWELTLDDGLLRLATSQPLSTLPTVPTTDVERRADLALRWYDRAHFVTDPIDKLLYLFFALESILGDKSEGLKAPALAVRRAMLGLLTTGHFTHPARTYLLYDQVRSAAVHGEEVPEVGAREVSSFAWDVRIAINEFLQFAAEQGLVKRKRVRRALDRHDRRQRVVAGLLQQDRELWERYLSPADEDSESGQEPPSD
jgi:hypothetical protein